MEHRCVLEGVGSTVGLENLLISRPLVISLHTSNPRPHLWCKAAIFFNHHHERRRARSSRAQVNTRKGSIYGADLADCCAKRLDVPGVETEFQPETGCSVPINAYVTVANLLAMSVRLPDSRPLMGFTQLQIAQYAALCRPGQLGARGAPCVIV